MLSNILLILVALLAVFLLYVALQPAESTVSRSKLIDAPPDAIFPLINSFRNWQHWSPWANLDPTAKNAFAGPEAGPGASFTWDGNTSVGKGAMTIADSDPNRRVLINLDFERPMASKSIAEFMLQPEGQGTRVTWTMTSARNFLARAMCTVFGADKMVGGMFDKGLARLGALAERKA